MDRAYAVLQVKGFDEDARTFRGIASTPETDFVGDVMEPSGAVFTLPLPMLWNHDRTQPPVGSITKARVTPEGIEVEGHLPGGVSARIDEIWGLIKAGVLRGLSIGFRARPADRVATKSGGWRYKRWLWHELSAVAIGANGSATIQEVKRLDHELLAASGQEQGAASNTPGVSGPVHTSSTDKGKRTMKTISDQIKDLEATRAARAAAMEETINKSIAEGRATTEEEGSEFDSLESEVKRLDADLKRLRRLEAVQIEKAQAITPTTGREDGINVRDSSTLRVEAPRLEPGIEFARYAMCVAAAKGNPDVAYSIARARYPDMARIHNSLEFAKSYGGTNFGELMLQVKAPVLAGTTVGATFAEPLVQYAHMADNFISWLRPQTIIGKFGQGNVPSLQRVPFNVTIPGQSADAAATWVGEGAPKPLTTVGFTPVTVPHYKIAAISVLTDELVRFSNPSAETIVRNSLGAAVIARADIDFVTPAKALSAGVSPASITNGANTAASNGGTEADIIIDVKALMAFYITANLTPTSGVWITNSSIALQLSLLTNALGNPVYPNVTMSGGTFAGLPMIVSQHVPAGLLILCNAEDIFLADDGQVTIDASREASLEMLDNPTNNSATGTATAMVSMFQTNSVALRAERHIAWLRRRAASVAYLTAVNYTG